MGSVLVVQALDHSNDQVSKPLTLSNNTNYYFKLSSSSSSSVLYSSTKIRGRFQELRKKKAPMATLVLNNDRAVAQVAADKKPAVVMTTLELTALVTLRKSQHKLTNVKDMMLRWFGDQAFPADPNQKEKGVVLQLVSTEIEPKRMKPKISQEAILDWTKKLKMGADHDQKSTYQVKFKVDSNLGMPGAVIVSNELKDEFYLESVNIEGVVDFPCNSWVQPHKANSIQRIFLSSKAYLPGETPEGLKELREMELRQLRGDGTGLRLPSDRIYNDIGDPDKGNEYKRPTLGGNENPHPRRCRTGLPQTKTDEHLESPVNESSTIYVPGDEEFEEAKQEALDVGKLKGLLRHIIPTVSTISRNGNVFKGNSDINGLYSDTSVPETKTDQMMKMLPMPKILNKVQENLKFDPPKLISSKQHNVSS